RWIEGGAASDFKFQPRAPSGKPQRHSPSLKRLPAGKLAKAVQERVRFNQSAIKIDTQGRLDRNRDSRCGNFSIQRQMGLTRQRKEPRAPSILKSAINLSVIRRADL